MPLPAGAPIGPYEIAALIGMGGMGEVYRARDTRLDRDVAIKIMNADSAIKPEARARFEREARAASSISHPHVAHVYEIGDSGDSDGTVQYMGPEQALGRSVDARTDLFSLGAVLYEMATGRLPFTGLSATETIEWIAHAQPDAVSRFNYGISPELERIIRKCLEKDPDRRYQSARELLVDLRNLKRDSDSGHGPVAPAQPAGTAAGRSRARVSIAAAVVLVALAAGGWFAWTRYVRGPAIDSLGVLPFVNATGDPETEYLADGLSETLIENLSKLPDLRIVPRGIAFRYKGKDIDPRAVAQELNVAAVVMGRVTQRDSDVTVQAELTAALAREVDPSMGRPEQSRIASKQTTNSEAYQLYLKGRYHWNKRTEAGFRLALDQFKQAIDRDPGYAAAYAGQADCYSPMARYQYEAPADSYPLARAAARRALDPGYATAHHWYALMLSAMGRLDEAHREIAEAHRLDPLSSIIAVNVGRVHYFSRRYDVALDAHRKGMLLDPAFGEGLLRLGWTLEELGRYDEAIEAYAGAARGGAMSKGSRGSALARAGRRREAEAVLSELVADRRHRRVDAYEIALVQMGLGRIDEAFALLNQAIDARSGMMLWLKVDPKWDPIRGDARFADLVRRLKLGV